MIGGVGIQHPISCMYQTVGSDLEVLPTVNGKLLTALGEGGFQYLMAGARANVGIKAGRYFFEVMIAEAQSFFEPRGRTQGPEPRQVVRVARPALDSSLALPLVTGGTTEKERLYTVKLTKSGDRKLGLDVDFMAERKVLPIMTVTGGVAEIWNQEHPELQISKGDSILKVNGVTGDVAAMLDRCKTDMELEP
eukprot:g32060.t4